MNTAPRVSLLFRGLTFILILRAGCIYGQNITPSEPDTVPEPGTIAEPGAAMEPSSDAQPVTAVQPDTAAQPVTTSNATGPWYNWLFDQNIPLSYGVQVAESYSDNIYLQPIKTYDYITNISPILSLTLGQEIALFPQTDPSITDPNANLDNHNYLKLVVQPNITLYAENPALNVVDEYADGIYTHRFGKLTMSLEQKYEKLSAPSLQTNAAGTLIHRDIFTTSFRANYVNSDRLTTYSTFNQTVNAYKSEAYTDSTQWEEDIYALYQLFPKLSLGAGPRIGFEDISQAPNQEYQALLFHLTNYTTGKITIIGAAGAELREFQNNASSTKFTPILEASVNYTPFDSTLLSLTSGRHRIVSNTEVGQDYTASTVTLSVRQRFLQQFFVTISGTYENDEYTTDAQFGQGPQRTDNFYSGKCGVEWQYGSHVVVDASYQYQNDMSTIDANSFAENRVSVSATIKY